MDVVVVASFQQPKLRVPASESRVIIMVEPVLNVAP